MGCCNSNAHFYKKLVYGLISLRVKIGIRVDSLRGKKNRCPEGVHLRGGVCEGRVGGHRIFSTVKLSTRMPKKNRCPEGVHLEGHGRVNYICASCPSSSLNFDFHEANPYILWKLASRRRFWSRFELFSTTLRKVRSLLSSCALSVDPYEERVEGHQFFFGLKLSTRIQVLIRSEMSPYTNFL